MITRILAIDLGSNMGVASGIYDTTALQRKWDIESIAKITKIERFPVFEESYLTSVDHQVKTRMYALAPDVDNDHLVILVPKPTFGYKTVARHWKMIGVIEKLAQEHGNVTVIEVLDNQIRKAVFGPTKKDMTISAYERRVQRKVQSMIRYGKYCETDDEADALMFIEWYLTSQ